MNALCLAVAAIYPCFVSDLPVWCDTLASACLTRVKERIHINGCNHMM